MALAVVAILAAVTGVVIGRNSKDDQQVSTETTSTEPTGDTSGTSMPPATRTAADDLAPYFAAAQRVDARLKHAAELVNGGIGPDQLVVDQATVDAVHAIDEEEAAAEIPAGLPDDVLLKVLVVQNDLASRSAALGSVGRVDQYLEGTPGTYPIGGPGADSVLTCLRQGSEAAAQFATDVAAARTLASSYPAITVAAPDSHAAGEVAVYLALVRGGNYGCDSCGGSHFTTLDPVSWHYVPPDTATGIGAWDGDVGGMLFKATYEAGTGWAVELNAC